VEQAFAIIAGLIFVPFYIEKLGIASFGLFGLFAVAQGVFQLLDAGLAPTLTRQVARFMSGVHTAEDFKIEFRVSEICFGGVALLITIISFSWISLKENIWLSSEQLEVNIIKNCINLIIFSVAIRFVSSLYKGILRGVESHILLAKIGVINTVIKFIIAIPVIIYSNGNPIPFFLLQLTASIFEIILLRFYLTKYIPQEKTIWTRTSIVLKRISSISGYLGVLSVAWIFLSVIDKLIISKMLPLETYGIFTLGITMASLVSLATNPIGIIIGPKLIMKMKNNNFESVRDFYMEISAYTTFFASSLAAMISFFGFEIIWIWIGNKNLANNASQIMIYYGVGYILIAISTLTYLLQYARGELKLNAIGAVFQSILLPVFIIIGLIHYDIKGAACAWLSIQIIYFIIWLPIIHGQIEKNLHKIWMHKSIIPNILIPFLWCGVISTFMEAKEDRILQLIELVFIFISFIFPALLIFKDLRSWTKSVLKI